MEDTSKKLFRDETRNIFMAVTLGVLHLAKKDGVDIKRKEALFDYCKKFQEQWKRKKNSTENYVLSEECNSHQQHEIPTKQQNVVTNCQDLVCVSDHSKSIDSKSTDDTDDGFESIFEEPRKTSNTTLKECDIFKKSSKTSLEIMRPNDVCYIKFTENVVSLFDEIEVESSNSPTSLYDVLFDKTEPKIPQACQVKESCLTEDSGYGTAETRSAGAENALQFILDQLKHEIDTNTTNVVENWKGSQIEVLFNEVVDKWSQKSIECREIVNNFIFDLLQDISNDMDINQIAIWSQKICIVKESLKTPSICQEVLNFAMGIVDDMLKAFTEHCFTPLMAIKASLFLEILPVTVRNLKVLIKSDNRTSDTDNDVTKLWQKRFCPGISNNHDQDEIQGIKTKITPKLERLLIITMQKEPLTSILVEQALNELKGLHVESQISQESQEEMY